MQRIELIWDIEERIQRALADGRTGEWDVIERLSQRDDIEWTRGIVTINAETMRCAVEQNFEVRPYPSEEADHEPQK